ncbi:putative dithiol-disulfide isomerase involved in polyketide biosynthesis [Frankia sp. EI5c]|uniref:DsbA family oxidoreductase n=1 Tax=Frankia sp. EI5c TaxID=683316 RepID=UPI0007C2DB6A|nr:DsbA family oxidoreductase [Frankia sp. EI5c]OAA18365.1 putative dithiol-disulfide isomerase involved in polyketide biosynthesis [Frankia sp. EI5c]
MKIEVWSDIVCPWCYIGKRRLEAALARYERAGEVEVVWRSFQLDPTQPRGENIPTSAMLARKYGVAPSEVRTMNDRVSALAAEEGLTYQLDRAVTANTFDAHRLVHFAAAHGLADPMKERLLRAVLVDGSAADDLGTLVRLATEVGLPADATRDVLNGDTYADDVHHDIQQARTLGIRGVPFYAVDRAYGISGAQPVETILDTLRNASVPTGP